MARRDIVVVGASLGGIEAIPRLVGALPADFPAAVLVVQHMQEGFPSYLPSIVARAAKMPFAAAEDGARIVPGRGYICVPNYHLMVEDGRIRLTRGPRESHARPAIDVLFRSAASEFGPRAIGVLLTGLLDDGTAGLWSIKDRGGVAIVQSPEEAAYPQMPNNAIRHVDVDFKLDIADMGAVLRRLTTEQLPTREIAMTKDDIETELRIARGESDFREDFARLGQPSPYTCPECHGSMRRIDEGTHRRFRCHTGHAFGEATLESEQSVSIGLALTQALALLEEQEMLLREMADGKGDRPPAEADQHRARAARVRQIGGTLRGIIDEVTLRGSEAGQSRET